VPAHAGKRQLKVVGGRFGPDNDKSCWNGPAPGRFFAQSSALSTHYLSIEPEQWHLTLTQRV